MGETMKARKVGNGGIWGMRVGYETMASGNVMV